MSRQPRHPGQRTITTYYYENALFEFYGIPVAWVPYFYTPDNTVQQRSGFLQPQYAMHSSTTGYSLTIPYYYAASPNYDITLSPTVTTQAGYLMETDWRQKLWNGAYEVKLYGSYDRTANDFWGDRNWRGSAETKGNFGLAKGWTCWLECHHRERRNVPALLQHRQHLRL